MFWQFVRFLPGCGSGIFGKRKSKHVRNAAQVCWQKVGSAQNAEIKYNFPKCIVKSAEIN